MAQYPLEITVAVDGGPFAPSEPIPVLIELHNVSGGPLVLPDITSLSQQTYLTLQVSHESGAPAFFLDPFAEPAMAVAPGTQVLDDDEALTFREVLNPASLGLLGYPQPGGAPQLLTGKFRIVASFEVVPDALPLAGDAALFRGPASSETPATFTVLPAAAGVAAAPALSVIALLTAVLALIAIGFSAIRTKNH